MTDSLRKWVFTIALATIAFAALILVVQSSTGKAMAETPPPSAVCNFGGSIVWTTQKYCSNLEEWMNLQIQAGRTHFVAVSVAPNSPDMMCAW